MLFESRVADVFKDISALTIIAVTLSGFAAGTYNPINCDKSFIMYSLEILLLIYCNYNSL